MTFFSNQIVNLWNNLPPSTADFTSFIKFDVSLSNPRNLDPITLI